MSSAATRLKKKLAGFEKDEVATTITKQNAADVDRLNDKYIDPEKDETHALFKSAKLTLQNQGLTLKKGDINSLNPHMGKQAAIDTLRFLGAFIYLVDLCVKIAYFRNTKWIS